MSRSSRPLITALVGALALLGAGCDPDPGDRWGGPLDPCDVTIGAEDEPITAREGASLDRLWARGPRYVWSTSPSNRCRDDAQTVATSRRPNTRLLITYPTTSAPTYTGRAIVAPGQHPVMIFAHANNDRVCEIFHRYYDLHDHWASWGYVVVSVDATDQNCQGGSKANIDARRDGVIAALESLEAFNADPDHLLYNHLALDRVALAGHSRGGGAVMAAAIHPDMAGRVAALINLQGIELTSYGYGTPEIAIPTLGITAGRDVDLDYPYVDATEDLLSGPYTWVTIYGGIHAWTASSAPEEPDDSPTIRQDHQHNVTDLYTTALLAHTLGIIAPGTEQAAPIDQSATLYSHAGARIAEDLSPAGAAQRWNMREADTILLDDFNVMTAEHPERLHTTAAGTRIEAAGLWRHANTFTYSPWGALKSFAYLKTRSRQLRAPNFERGFARFYTTPTGAPLTLSPTARLQARVKGEDARIARVALTLQTARGAVTVPIRPHIGPRPLTNRFTQLDLPLAEALGVVGGAPIDLVSVTFEVEDGGIFIDDLGFFVD